MTEITVLIIILSVFAVLNIGLNAFILYYLHNAQQQLNETMRHHNIFADVYSNMEASAAENAETIFECITDRSNFIASRLEHIHRRQNTVANMIREDRDRLKEHDAKVEELRRIAQGLAEKIDRQTSH